MTEPYFGHAVVTPPTVEPVTVQEVQAHLRIDSVDDEDLVTALAVAARQWCEDQTGRQFCTATLRSKLSGFPSEGPITLPRAPASAITSITYLDSAGASQTLSASDYVLAADLAPAEVHLAPGASWPTTAERPDAVTITYTAGYGGAAAAVPQPIRSAILLKCQALYDRDPKEAEMLEHAVKALLVGYRVSYF